MRYLLSVGGAVLLAWTVRFITGSVAGLFTFVIVLVFSIVLDPRPLLFFILSFSVWILIRYESRRRLLMMNSAPILAVLVLLSMSLPIVPVIGLFLANAITLISLAYRGWANKRLLD